MSGAMSGTVGILMLETRFPRLEGDIGHPGGWPFPVRYATVAGASPERAIVRGGEGLIAPFLAAGRDLVAAGAAGVTTSCGFLSIFQDRLAAGLGVPVAASALLQVAPVQRLLPPGSRVGILTISASRLTSAHLAAAGVPDGTPIGTTEGGREFTRAILADAADFDVEAARADNVEAARALQAAHPDLGALVLECTNMPPYAADIRSATGLPVYTIRSLLAWFQAGLAPPSYAPQVPLASGGAAR
jgi:hypothetical protein